MAKRADHSETPIYCLDAFSLKAKESSFYIEKFKTHLKDHEFISRPHKHDFYLLLYVTRGKGVHTIDFRTYPVRPGSFFVMTPGQVHSWTLDAEADGYIIFFTPEFYRMLGNNNSLVEFPFFNSQYSNAVIQLPHDDAIDTFVKEMFKEFTQSFSAVDLRILRTYLDLLLLKLTRAFSIATEETSFDLTYKLRKLEQLIDKNYKTVKQPKEYGDLMNLTPSYLNNLCKQGLNKTLSDLIAERVALEAKRLFAYTSLTVDEVADQLNFSTATYFVRFFKKQTGLTPEQFKQSLNRAVQ